MADRGMLCWLWTGREEFYSSKEFWQMEIGLRSLDHIPCKKMGLRQFVAALTEIYPGVFF